MDIKYGNNFAIINKYNKSVLVSYQTPVAARIDGELYVSNKFYSKTTSKHINNFSNNSKIAIKKSPEFFESLLTEM